LTKPSFEGYAIAITPDNSKVIFGTKDNTIIIWDITRQIEFGILKGHTDTIYDVAITPDGSKIV